MTWDSRVLKERHLPEIPAEVRAADSHAVSLDECLTQTWLARIVHVDFVDTLGSLKLNRAHDCFL